MDADAQRLWNAMTPLQQRIAQLQTQSLVSEHNRRVKLEARPDATQRQAAAVMKRMRKAERRQAEARRAG